MKKICGFKISLNPNAFDVLIFFEKGFPERMGPGVNKKIKREHKLLMHAVESQAVL